MTTSASSMIDSGSSVRRDLSTAGSRGAETSLTAIPTSSSWAPDLAARSSFCSESRRATWVPTVPAPRRAILTTVTVLLSLEVAYRHRADEAHLSTVSRLSAAFFATCHRSALRPARAPQSARASRSTRRPRSARALRPTRMPQSARAPRSAALVCAQCSRPRAPCRPHKPF